ncbi:MAG: hypothetical protein IPI11_16225 [Haliscomenobacter sp.]|nr:hypothetical protein [Haliscomenobacter sp.]
MIEISVLIPYRDRIKNLVPLMRNLKIVKKEKIEFLLLSLGDSNKNVKHLCKEAGVNYHYIDFDEVFTIGLAHNYGAKIAIGEYILKQDVDCIPYVSFYDKVLDFKCITAR